MSIKCPIWKTRAHAYPSRGGIVPIDSIRAGGHYEIDNFLYGELKIEDDRQKAKLTTMLIDKRIQEHEKPYIDYKFVEESEKKEPLSVSERSDRLLMYLSNKSKEDFIGCDLNISTDSDIEYESLAWSESIRMEEVISMIDDLEMDRYLKVIKRNEDGLICQITTKGHKKAEQYRVGSV